MKKTVLFLFLSLMMMGCKKIDDGKTQRTENDCGNNATIKQLLNLKEGQHVAWLKTNGHKICDESLYECLLQFHDIESEIFDKLATSHPDNAVKIEYYEKTWEEIENTIKEVNCYEKYLTFKFVGTELKLETIYPFTTERSCYSIPFLKGIQSKYKLLPTSKLYFTKALIPVHIGLGTIPQEKVIFKIGNVNDGSEFYDISDYPGETPFYFPSGI